MKILRLILLVLFSTSILVLSGCGVANVKKEDIALKKPVWILNPNLNGKRGAVGVAGRTYDGKISTQRKLAIQRALDELAIQQGVKVKLSMTKREREKNGNFSTSSDIQSMYETTNNSAITAHIEDIWEDKVTGDLYIWLVLDK